MKKGRQRGFLLAEAFIVSTFVLGVLVFMYIQVRSILNNYNKSFTYNNPSGIYIANEVDKYFASTLHNTVASDIESAGFLDITNYNGFMENLVTNAKIKKIIVSSQSFAWNIKGMLDSKFYDYINWVGRTKNLSECNYVLLIEFNDETFSSLKK